MRSMYADMKLTLQPLVFALPGRGKEHMNQAATSKSSTKVDSGKLRQPHRQTQTVSEFVSLYAVYTHSTSRIVHHSCAIVLLADQCRLHNAVYSCTQQHTTISLHVILAYFNRDKGMLHGPRNATQQRCLGVF